MSYIKHITEDLIIPSEPSWKDVPTGNKDWTPPSVMEWEPDYEWILHGFFCSCRYPFRNSDMSGLSEPLKSGIYRFFLALDGYLEQKNPKLSHTEILLGVSTGPNYATYLKRLRWKAFLTTSGGIPQEYPDWWNEIPAISVNDIGEIFNYQYLPHWKEDIDDYKEGLDPLKQDDSVLRDFRNTLMEILPEELPCEIIDPREILLELSGSTSSLLNGTKVSNWEGKQSENYMGNHIGTGIRTVVQVHPEGARDTVILSIPASNTVKWIERQTAMFLEDFQESLQIKSEDSLRKNLNEFYENHTWFLERDLKKEGIKKPRTLLKIMLEVLHEKYPQVGAWGNPSFYDNFSLLVDGEKIYPPRGHGLGMANSLTTLMQIVIHYQVLNSEQGLQCEFRDHISMRALNDDNVSGFQTLSDLEIYWDAETEIMEGLDLTVSPSKSRKTPYGFCVIERYYSIFHPFISKKESYKRRELLNTLACVNITHAKDIFISAAYSCHEYVKDYLGEIVRSYGYEFFPGEWEYPASCGGWYTPSIKGVSLEYKILEKLPYDARIYCASEACKIKLLKRTRKNLRKIPYKPPCKSLFPLLTEEIKEMYFGTKEDIYNTFYRPALNPEETKRDWSRLRLIRQERFNRRYKSIPTYYDWITDLIKSNDRPFIPPDLAIEKWVDSEIWKGSCEDWYSSHTPQLSWVASSLTEAVTAQIFPNPYSITTRITDQVNHGLSASIRRQLGRQIDYRLPDLCLGQMVDGYLIPKEPLDQERFFKDYEFPKRIGHSLILLGYNKVPLLRKNFLRKEAIELKERVFGKILTPREEDILSGLYKPGRKVLLQRLASSLIRENVSLEVLESVDLVKPVEPKFEISYSSEDDSDDEENKELLVTLGKYPISQEGYWSWDSQTEDRAPITDFSVIKNFKNVMSLSSLSVGPSEEQCQRLYNRTKQEVLFLLHPVVDSIWRFAKEPPDEDYDIGGMFD